MSEEEIQAMYNYLDSTYLLRLATANDVLAALTDEEAQSLIDTLVIRLPNINHSKLLYLINTEDVLEELATRRHMNLSEIVGVEDICQAMTIENIPEILYYLKSFMPDVLQEFKKAITNTKIQAIMQFEVTEKSKASDIQSEVPQPVVKNKQVADWEHVHKITRNYTEPKSYHKWTKSEVALLKTMRGSPLVALVEHLKLSDPEITPAAVASKLYSIGFAVRKGVICGK